MIRSHRQLQRKPVAAVTLVVLDVVRFHIHNADNSINILLGNFVGMIHSPGPTPTDDPPEISSSCSDQKAFEKYPRFWKKT
jgi:hypothetical protein